MKKTPEVKRKMWQKVVKHSLPEYCDYSCIHASFPPVDVVGACRKEAGVYCTLVKRYNNKNARCLVRID